MRRPSNPFVLSGYHSPNYFCDRENELEWFMEQFDNERNAVLHSWRRIGKTALVKHFFHHLEKKEKSICIFVDLLGTTNLIDANKRIVAALLQQFGEPDKSLSRRLMNLLSSIGATVGLDPISGVPQLSFGIEPTKVQSPTSLEVIGKFLLESKRPVIICLDEFQQIVNYPETNAEAIFRTWMQQFPMIRFIFSGSHRHMMLSIFSEKARPFYRSAQLTSLGPIQPDSYRKFIQRFFKQAGKTIAPKQIDKIFDWTRMQTYYVQLACNKLYARPNVIGEETLNEIFYEILQQEIPVFSSYQQLFTKFQWKLLIAIAKRENVENPTSQGFLLSYNLGAASSVGTAMSVLVKKEFVIHDEMGYTLHDTLLMRWLQQI